MKQSARDGEAAHRFHVAIIMDGNGRWARARGRPREWGHRQGVRAVRAVVEAAPQLGIDVLTLYAFSSDNWNRPRREVRSLMALLRRYLRSESPSLAQNGVRLRVIGRRDRLHPDLVRSIDTAESFTSSGRRLLLRIAVDYSSRGSLLEAARQCAAAGSTDCDRFEEMLAAAMHAGEEGAPDVDLLVRTGGEQRLSDFLLWECAYAELLFTPRMWPEFGADDLAAALDAFRQRDRRFGRVAAAG